MIEVLRLSFNSYTRYTQPIVTHLDFYVFVREWSNFRSCSANMKGRHVLAGLSDLKSG